MPWNVCFLKDIVFFGQYINRKPRIFCFFIAMFRTVWLIIQEKLLVRSSFVNHFDFPGSASRDVTMTTIIVRAISIATNTTCNGIFWNIFFNFFDWSLFWKQPIKKFKEYSKKFHHPRVSPGDQPLARNHPRPQGYPVFLNVMSRQSSRWPNGLEALGTRMAKNWRNSGLEIARVRSESLVQDNPTAAFLRHEVTRS